jgi:transposase
VGQSVFKSNTLEPTKAGTWARMYHLFAYEREAFMEHYHKRSNIETAFSMIKGKFGHALRSKSDTGQILLINRGSNTFDTSRITLPTRP